MRRCVIYTRKSTEEGLDQAFNSLDAQREACEAFVKSQRQEGWRLLPGRFDDGGYSGGSIDRPALTQLLVAVDRGEVDVIVVYKVDRLTRSLAEFAKIVDRLDARGASFVSVTQQFNTSSSMGRLTLNVLLSFAQFEREVTAERIRDKIAASKKKGMWMGGRPPLGYDVDDRKLIINNAEAETVCKLFGIYLELGTVRALCDEASRRGIVTKRRLFTTGKKMGGKPFTRGNLYQLLANPLYVGRVRYKDQTYEGQHEAILDAETWTAAQAQLAGNSSTRRIGTNAKRPSLLTGLAFDETGDRLCPTHATKAGKRYRYYISKRLMHEADRHADGWRLRADELENAVTRMIRNLLVDRARLAQLSNADGTPVHVWAQLSDRAQAMVEHLADPNDNECRRMIQEIVLRIELSNDAITVLLDRAKLREYLGLDADAAAPDHGLDTPIKLETPFAIRRRGVEAKLVIAGPNAKCGEPDPDLCKLIAQAHCWFNQLAKATVSSVRDIVAGQNMKSSEVSRILPLAFLAPDIVKAIIDGRQPVDLTAQTLRRLRILPADWAAQRRLFGFVG
jgi:site-specific DNA recombinase